MQQLTILNTREVKRINDSLMQQFGYSLQENYAYLLTENDRVFIINKDFGKIDTTKLIIDRVGLYFAEFKNERARLSKEGTQLFVREAEKNKKTVKNRVELTMEEIKLYFQGTDIPKDLGSENKLVILWYDKDVLGCAQYKEGKILNFLPKIHRGEVIV